jgi:hypothetical protein
LLSLGLRRIDEIVAAGLGNQQISLSVYLVSLALLTLSSKEISVIAHPEEPWILLGRDVLNLHRCVLDGPNLMLEIE